MNNQKELTEWCKTFLAWCKDVSISDYNEVEKFLLECPERYFYVVFREGNESEDGPEGPKCLTCSECEKRFCYSYTILHHCSTCDNDDAYYSVCPGCFFSNTRKHAGHHVTVDYLVNIFTNFYLEDGRENFFPTLF